MTTIRDMVKAIQADVRDNPDMPPHQAAEHVNTLAALLGNINQEETRAELDYAEVQAMYLKQEEAASRATILSKTTAEYRTWREMRDWRKTVELLLSALKNYTRTATEEMRMTR